MVRLGSAAWWRTRWATHAKANRRNFPSALRSAVATIAARLAGAVAPPSFLRYPMKILLAIDGSPYTKMLAYLTTHSEMLAGTQEYTALTVQTLCLRAPVLRWARAVGEQ